MGTVVNYNTLLLGYKNTGEVDKAEKVLGAMKKARVVLQITGEVDKAEKALAAMKKSRVVLQKTGEVDKAEKTEKVLAMMKKSRVRTRRTILQLFAESDDMINAEELRSLSTTARRRSHNSS